LRITFLPISAQGLPAALWLVCLPLYGWLARHLCGGVADWRAIFGRKSELDLWPKNGVLW